MNCIGMTLKTLVTLILVNLSVSFSLLSMTARNMFLSNSNDKMDIKLLPALLKYLPKPTIGEEDYKILRFQLGNSFKPEYMSIGDPRQVKAMDDVGRNNEGNEHEDDMQTHPQMSNELKEMTLKKVYSKMPKSHRKRATLGKRTSHRMKNWLWNLSKCPVYYTWMDLGENIFPRYIKRGECSKKKTCSYPAGMKCQPKGWRDVNVLIYVCLKEINSVKLGCKWRQMTLNVLTECQCGCNNKQR